MFDFGWAEFLVIGFVLLLVVGPKDIPKIMYQCGKGLRRLQYMRYALTHQFDDFMEKTDKTQDDNVEKRFESTDTVDENHAGDDDVMRHKDDAEATLVVEQDDEMDEDADFHAEPSSSPSGATRKKGEA